MNALSYSTAGYREVGRGQLAGTEVLHFEKPLAQPPPKGFADRARVDERPV